jgi:hypothetical protein
MRAAAAARAAPSLFMIVSGDCVLGLAEQGCTQHGRNMDLYAVD